MPTKLTMIKYSIRYAVVVFVYLFLISSSVLFSQSKNWSDPKAWSQGSIPKTGEAVVIPEGEVFVLDTDTASLDKLIINGTLRFASKDIKLTARWIMVHGLLEIGTSEEPYANQAIITLTGPKEDVNGMGGRFLLTMMGGSIEIHSSSAQKTNWTQLGATARAGSTTIQLKENPVGWNVGDHIAIAPSGYDPYEAEEVSITGIEGNVITFTPALQYDHYGDLQTYEGKLLDERAEVGMLTRNVIIQGASDSVEKRYGAHGMIMEGSGPIHIEGVELRLMGQPGIPARYSFHWHLAGNRKGDYFRNSSIHHGLQRGVVIHQTDEVLIENNVVYNVQNHAYVPAEDGNEINNQFLNNLSILTRLPDEGFFAFPKSGKELKQSNQGEHRSSGFWLRNAHNILLGNHAAGAERGVGFFYDRFARSREFRDFDLLPEPIVFKNNVAHSNSVPGVNNNAGTNVATYSQVGHGFGLFIDNFNNGDLNWVFEDFTSYKNAMGGIWSELENVTLSNSIMADNSVAFFTGQSKVANCIAIGKSANDIGGPNRKLRDGHSRAGYYPIAQGGAKKPRFENVTFIDINKDVTNIAAAAVGSYKTRFRGNYFSGITLKNSQAIYMRTQGAEQKNPGGAYYYDKDGSLTGYNYPVIVIPETSPLVNDDCTYHEEWRAWVCNTRNLSYLSIDRINRYYQVIVTDDDNDLFYTSNGGVTRYFAFYSGREYNFSGIEDFKEEEDILTLHFNSFEKQQGEWLIANIDFIYNDASIRDINNNLIPRLATKNSVYNSSVPAFYFSPVNNELYVKLVSDPSGENILLVETTGQKVSGDNGVPTDNIPAAKYVRVFPNPLTKDSRIEFSIIRDAKVTMEVFDILGRKLNNLMQDEAYESGEHSYSLSSFNLSSGVYIINVIINGLEIPVKVVQE